MPSHFNDDTLVFLQLASIAYRVLSNMELASLAGFFHYPVRK